MELKLLGLKGSFYLPVFDLNPWATLSLLVCTGVVLWVVWRTQRGWLQLTGWRMVAFAGAVLAAVVVTRLVTIEFAPPHQLRPLGIPAEPQGPSISVLGGILVLLTGAYLGAGPALAVGFVSGLVRAGWGSYNPFEPFEVAFVAALAAVFMRQRLAGQAMRILRQPLFAGAAAAAIIWPLRIGGFILFTTEPSLASIDYAVAQVWPSLAAAVGEMLIAGALMQAAHYLSPGSRPLSDLPADQPAPWQTSLSRQLFFIFLPVTLLGNLVVVWAVLAVGGDVATDMVVEQMAHDANTAANALPLFVQTGGNLLRDLADSLHADDARVDAVLREGTRVVPFFAQLTYFEQTGEPVAQYPAEIPQDYPPVTPDELDLIAVTLDTGMPHDAVLAATPAYRPVANFIVPVGGEDGAVAGALLGRTRLDDNPITQPMLANLRSAAGGEGEGFVVDDAGNVILQPTQPGRATEPFNLDAEWLDGKPGSAYTREVSNGQLQLVYVRRAEGTGWSVVIVTPHHVVLERAARVAVPLAALLLVVSLAGLATIYVRADRAARPIVALATAADHIAGGDLDYTVSTAGSHDEVGRLSTSFAHMRNNLKSRLDEQALMLQISQAVSTSFDLESTLTPILEGCLQVTGAAGVRVALIRDSGVITAYGVANTDDSTATDMAALDRRLLDLVSAQGSLEIEYLSHASEGIVDTSALKEPLGGLVARPLRHEDSLLGVLWIGFRQVHRLNDAERAFLETLASQAAVTVAKAWLYEAASRGREHLEVILNSTPDAVLVTDRHGVLVMANPASTGFLSCAPAQATGQLVDAVVVQPELLRLFQSNAAGPQAEEVASADNRTYSAIASPLMTDGQPSGRVVLLHDITHLKELDAMKDDFVQIVSHDLRSPLTYMRGYATMLGMVGPLNEKQQSFADKIVVGIEQMSNLIENVLDIGRIESGGELERAPCDVSRVVGEVIDASRGQATTKKIKLSVEAAPNLPVVMADEHLLRQAITNLVDNAIKYTPQAGEVKVETALDDGNNGRPVIIVKVSDNGPGIAAADQEHLFEKFYRVRKKETIKVKGSGLGLTIVKGVAQRHGGDAWVESQLGKGATFYLSIEVSPPEGSRGEQTA